MPLFRFIVRGNMGQTTSDPWEFTQHVYSDSSHGVVHTAARDWVDRWWLGPIEGAGYRDMVVNFIQLVAVETLVVDIGTGLQSTRIRTDYASAGASAATSSLPMHIAVCVTVNTAIANRSGRGRYFLPPPALEHVTLGGRFFLSSLDQIASLIESAYLAWSGVGVPVLYRKTSRSIEPIVSFSIDNELEVMRSRKLSIPPLVDTRPIPT